MWYSNSNKKELDYSKPIAAASGGEVYLLMPQIVKGSYNVVGYNWFSINRGVYNSCACYDSPRDATRAYPEAYNVIVDIEKE